MKKLIFLFTICLSFITMSCDGKNYSVEISGNSIYITMPSPSVGIAGRNVVSFEGFTYDELEEAVFNKIRRNSYNGDYTVYVTLTSKDSYGNGRAGGKVRVSTLNGADVKRYKSFYYFRGKTKISNAFPWAKQYM